METTETTQPSLDGLGVSDGFSVSGGFVIVPDEAGTGAEATINERWYRLYSHSKAMCELMVAFNSELEPGYAPQGLGIAVHDQLSKLENLATAARILITPAIAATGEWKRDGAPNPERWFAGKTGKSPAKARAEMETGKNLGNAPGTRKAFLEGEISAEQADTISDVAEVNPEAEQDLLDAAKKQSLKELKDEAARRKAEVEDVEERERRLHKKRYVRTWTDREGAWNLHAKGPVPTGADFMSVLERLIDQQFKQARKNGVRGTRDNYGFDALMDMAAQHRFGFGGLAPANATTADAEAPNTERTAPEASGAAPAKPNAPASPSGGATTRPPSAGEARSGTAKPWPCRTEPSSREEPADRAEPAERTGKDSGGGSRNVAKGGADGRSGGRRGNAGKEWPGENNGKAGNGDAGSESPGGPTSESGENGRSDDGGSGPRPKRPTGPTNGSTGSTGSTGSNRGSLVIDSEGAMPGSANSIEDRADARSPGESTRRRRQPVSQQQIYCIDWDALVRGSALTGERCELRGVAPVSVLAVRTALASSSAKLVVTDDNGRVITVAHLGTGTINVRLIPGLADASPAASTLFGKAAAAAASDAHRPGPAGHFSLSQDAASKLVIIRVHAGSLADRHTWEHGADAQVPPSKPDRAQSWLPEAGGTADHGDHCINIPGLGEVSRDRVLQVLGGQVMARLATRGQAVRSLVHTGRAPTAAQKVALAWADTTCSVGGCPNQRVEIDHRSPWATERTTELNNLDPLCAHHHRQKSAQDAAQRAGTARR